MKNVAYVFLTILIWRLVSMVISGPNSDINHTLIVPLLVGIWLTTLDINDKLKK